MTADGRPTPIDVIAAVLSASGARNGRGVAQRITNALMRARYRIVEDRSKDEHNLFFGVIGLAYDNWPVSHQYQPISADELRAWLLIEAGHSESMLAPEVVGTNIEALVAVGKFFCRGARHFRLKQAGDGVAILRPRSVDGTLPVKEFRVVAQAVYEIVESVTGITPETYKRWKEDAVGHPAPM